MRKITWNTGRQYTKRGQVIVAVVTDTGEVLFNDTCRMINGTVGTPDPFLIETNSQLREHVMHCYDNGKYEYSNLAGTNLLCED